jgi:hypothetical protein
MADWVLSVGQLVWATIIVDGKQEARPCVVTAVTSYKSSVIEVVYGQDRVPASATAFHLVRKASTLGVALGLTKDSNFCSRTVVYAVCIERVCDGTCPEFDLVEVLQLAEDQRLL